MNAFQKAFSGLIGTATTAASDAAAAKASAAYEQYKPLVYLGAFLAVTLYLFYFLPRFTLPWRRATV